MVSVLFFDFGGTLDGPLHWLDRFVAQYRAMEVDISRDELAPAFDHATSAGYRAEKTVQRFGLADLVRFHAGNQIEFLVRQSAEPVRARFATLDSARKHRIVEGIAAGFVRATRQGMESNRGVLAALKERFRIGVISNFYGNLDRILEEAGMNRSLDTIIDSSRVGIFKPDHRIFEKALSAIGVKAVDAAMIGDSLRKDCAPAHRLGLKTVWYRSPESVHPAAKDEAAADFMVSSLGEVANLRW